MNKNVLSRIFLSVLLCSVVSICAEKVPPFSVIEVIFSTVIDGVTVEKIPRFLLSEVVTSSISDGFYALKKHLKKCDTPDISSEEKRQEYERLLLVATSFSKLYGGNFEGTRQQDQTLLLLGMGSAAYGLMNLYFSYRFFHRDELSGNRLEEIIHKAGIGAFLTTAAFLVARRSYDGGLLRYHQREIDMMKAYLSHRIKELDDQNEATL